MLKRWPRSEGKSLLHPWQPKKAKPKTTAQPNPLRLEIINHDVKLALFMAAHRSQIEPFLPPPALARLPSQTKKKSSAPRLPKPAVQPACISGTMHPHQLLGLAWLLSMYDAGAHPILGDEMGLGKTLQTIAFIASLKLDRKLEGPVLIVAPLTVLSTWTREFNTWCPRLRVLKFYTTCEDERKRLKKVMATEQHDCILTTYETIKGPMFNSLSRKVWRALVLDEGHKIKCEDSAVAMALQKYHAVCRVLLTGFIC